MFSDKLIICGRHAPCGDAGGPASGACRGPALSTFGGRTRMHALCRPIHVVAEPTSPLTGPSWTMAKQQSRRKIILPVGQFEMFSLNSSTFKCRMVGTPQFKILGNEFRVLCDTTIVDGGTLN
jgi:hypothetical protein